MISFRGVVNDEDVVNLNRDGFQTLVKRPMGHAINRWRFSLVRSLYDELDGGSLNRRSGNLQKGTKVSSVKISGDSVVVNIESQVPYAMIYDERSAAGRTIYPASATYLTVPVPHDYEGKHPKPLADYPEKTTFLKPLKGGGGYLVFLKKKPRSASIPIYRLVPSVKLPYRPWIRRGIDNALPKLKEIVSNIVEKGR